jgi:hypothetical protein
VVVVVVDVVKKLERCAFKNFVSADLFIPSKSKLLRCAWKCAHHSIELSFLRIEEARINLMIPLSFFVGLMI